MWHHLYGRWKSSNCLRIAIKNSLYQPVQAVFMSFGVASSAVVMGGVIIRIEICVRNDLTGTGRMDKLTVANVNADMGQTCFICILEEDRITGLQICFGNGGAFGIHGSLRTADINAVGAQNIVDKAGAVKTAGIGATPFVRNT